MPLALNFVTHGFKLHSQPFHKFPKKVPSPERQGVAESALADANEEGADGLVCQQLLCLSPSDDAVEPLV